MNWTFWLGIAAGGVLAWWSFKEGGGGRTLFSLHGIVIVLGGTVVATLINCPFRHIVSALGSIVSLFLPSRLPAPGDIVGEMTRLARRAQTEGGLLSLQGESANFAGGFLNRAINVAIATGESDETRRILESEVRRMRIQAQEDANLLRTMGTLSPMFGLLGTLLGMIRVLETISTPAKVGPAMALALSSAFIGISFANLVCVPVAGQLRLRAINETMVLEMILEGVLDISAGKPPSIVELHLLSYSAQRQRGAAASSGAGA